MSRWARLFSRRKRMMEDLDQDIRDHLEREAQDNIERGMSPEEAHYVALRKFGNVTRVKEDTWEVWSFVRLEQLWQDVRFGLRMLRKSPGFRSRAHARPRHRRDHGYFQCSEWSFAEAFALPPALHGPSCRTLLKILRPFGVTVESNEDMIFRM